MPQVRGPRRFRNSEKLVRTAEPVWRAAADHSLLDLSVTADGVRLATPEQGHQFINMCSCSYLGLNGHPEIVAGAIAALQEQGNTWLSVSTTRIRSELLTRLEHELGALYRANVLVGLSCSALTASLLPLLASGHLTDGGPRVMVFDRFCHFSMSYVKPICADESLVLTCGHNDLDRLEEICRQYPSVAYVADGAYSMGGTTALEGLLELQERYGLFLFFDDSHSLSIDGPRGEGFVRSRVELNPLTMIVASMAKAFGTKGGAVMFSRPELRGFLLRHAGVLSWSQNLGVADLGASLASVAIHQSTELADLQRTLRGNIKLFDELVPTKFAGDGLPIRLIALGDHDLAIRASAELYRRGFYSSAVFFPIVARGDAGIRVMLRADLTRAQITEFAGALKEVA